MTTFQNVNQSVALNNDVLAMGFIPVPRVFSNPSQTNGVNATFQAVVCIPDPNPYWGAAGQIADVGVIWRGPAGGQVSLQILNNGVQQPDADLTVTFTAGQWSDANIATLEEAAAAVRKTLDVPGGGVSDETRAGLKKVLDAIETELKKQLGQ